jgi:predicted RNA-binding protein with PIN domain
MGGLSSFVRRMRFLVDGMNVIGSRPDGWWLDRPAARRALVEALGPLAASGDEITVVFDGNEDREEVEDASASGIEVVFAPGGPNAADHMIVRLAEKLGPVGELKVVTSDRALAGRVQQLGAVVERASSFRASLDG